MAIARETVRLGLAARGAAKIKVRQPLHECVIVADGRERAAIERLGDVVREELNVKQLRFVEQADELGSYTLKPNYRTLGPRFGKAMPQVAEAVAALDRRPRRGVAARGARRSASSSTATTTRSAPTTCCSRSRRCRTTSSSARARTPSRWSSRSTTTCAARASRARSSTPSSSRAARPGWTSPTASTSRSTATRRCSRPRARTRRTSPARCSPSASPTPPTAARRLDREHRGPRAADLGRPRRLSRTDESAPRARSSAGRGGVRQTQARGALPCAIAAWPADAGSTYACGACTSRPDSGFAAPDRRLPPPPARAAMRRR